MSTTSKRLSGKSALITGGNSGIGLATARLFVAEGARIAITGRNQKTLDAPAAEPGDGILAIKADAADVASTERAASDDSSIVHGTEIVVDGGATDAPHGAPAYRAA